MNMFNKRYEYKCYEVNIFNINGINYQNNRLMFEFDNLK